VPLTSADTFSYVVAQKLQIELSKLVKFEPIDVQDIDVIVATDVGYRGSKGVGVALAYDAKKKRELCHIAITDKVDIPYVPGLLAFREAPLMIGAIKELSLRCVDPDVIMVNGHGVSHPRKFGIASHIGVVLEKPSIGVAKKLLYGTITIDDKHRLAIVVGTLIVGYVVENIHGGKIYVSVGHRITPEKALTIVENIWNKSSSLPDPLYIADNLTKRLRSRI
jgi:deoxyribonuclease V